MFPNKKSLLKVVTLALLLCCVASVSVIAYSVLVGTDSPSHAHIAVPTPTPTPILTPTDQFNVALDAPGTTAKTGVGTNIQNENEVTPPDAQPAKSVLGLLQNWQQPMLRVHFGFSGKDTPFLPEATQGSWDFSRVDPVIATLNAQHLSFFMDVRTAPPWMFDSQGTLPDQNFSLFATYMARLVGWYNKGGFTDDNGKFHASGHTNSIHNWEIWNEPKSAEDIPVNVPDRHEPIWMTADRYARLYDMTVGAMRAVDPTIITGGPALGSWADQDNYWLKAFIQDEHAPLAFLSFHFYAATSPTEPDAQLFASVTGDRFLDRLTANRTLLDQLHPGQHIPIWITEMNIDETSFLPLDLRGTSPVEFAFLVDTLVTAEYQGVALIDQFNIVSTPQYGLIDYKTFQIYRPAWFYQQFSQLFPPGSLLLPITTGPQSGVRAMAMITADHKSLRILVGNIQAANATDVNGQGVPKEIRINLSGKYQGVSVSPQAQATIWHFDAQSPQATMPAAAPLGFLAGQTALQVALPGYGTAMITIPLS